VFRRHAGDRQGLDVTGGMTDRDSLAVDLAQEMGGKLRGD
tara:strand:- start:1134 stop:1253 length:120 start_codon:yes stop_codon:yes gene_type:complete